MIDGPCCRNDGKTGYQGGGSVSSSTTSVHWFPLHRGDSSFVRKYNHFVVDVHSRFEFIVQFVELCFEKDPGFDP
jgi:hypothetical protein